MRFDGFEGKWEEGRIGDDCNILMCKRIFAEQTYETEEIPFYKIGTLGESPDAYISRVLFEEYKNKYNYPRKGEVLITCSGTVGKCIKFDGKDAYYQDSNIVWIDNPTSKINNDFLYYTLSNINWGTLNSTTIARIYGSDLRNLLIKYPQKHKEQDKIVSLLSIIDDRIQTQSKVIQQLESSIKGLANKLFTQRLRLKNDKGHNFSDWQMKVLGEVCEKKSSNISANKIESNFGKYIIYGASGILKNVDFYEEEEDYISIVKDGAGVGRLFYCKGKSSVLGTMDIIKPKIKTDTYFLFYLLSNIDFTKYVTGSTIPHIYFKDYKNESCIIPSIDEQTKIANFLSTIDRKIRVETDILMLLTKQKEYLLSNLFI